MKTIDQLFKEHQHNQMADGFVAPYLRYADFADALIEHDNEIIKLIGEIYEKRKMRYEKYAAEMLLHLDASIEPYAKTQGAKELTELKNKLKERKK